MNALGWQYQNGRGGLAKDEIKALDWYRKSAAHGNNVAMANIGDMYLKGMAGLPASKTQATAWFRKAAAAGNSSAQKYLRRKAP